MNEFLMLIYHYMYLLFLIDWLLSVSLSGLMSTFIRQSGRRTQIYTDMCTDIQLDRNILNINTSHLVLYLLGMLCNYSQFIINQNYKKN